MKKLFATLLLAPVVMFSESNEETADYQKENPNIDLTYFWQEVSLEDHALAHYHINKEKPKSFNDYMYVELSKLYLSILMRDTATTHQILRTLDREVEQRFELED